MTEIWTGAFGLILLALIAQPALSADWPDCKFQCQANDVIVERLWLGDDGGGVISSPVAGEEPSCYLWAAFRNNANAPRYAAILLADLYQGGTLSQSFYDDGLCVLDEIEAKSTVSHPLCSLEWTRGEEVILKRLVLSWETAKGTSCSEANRKCSNRNTKCYGGQEEELLADSPLLASFEEDSQDCSGLVNFVDRTTGGIGPYSYDWDFGDGAISTENDPDHTYNQPGDYLVRLIVSDKSGKKASVSRILTIEVCTCAIIGQNHACLSKTETYSVSQKSSIHGMVRWYLDGREIYENESIDIYWQNYGAGQHDLMAYVSNESSTNGRKPWATCNMTITVTPEPLAVIGWVA